MSVLVKKCWYLLFGVRGGVSAGQLITVVGGTLENSRGEKGAGGRVLWCGKGPRTGELADLSEILGPTSGHN